MHDMLTKVDNFILYYFIGTVVFYTLLLLGAYFSIVNFFKRDKFADLPDLLDSKALPPVTIILPIYNEQENIINALESALNSTYTNLFVIGVNDGSTDNTLNLLKEHYNLYEVPAIIEQQIPTPDIKSVYVSKTNANLMIVDKLSNTGAGDALNIGINACFTPYFFTADADSLIGPSEVTELVYEAMTNESAIVVSGGVYILNGCKYNNGIMLEPLLSHKLVPALQTLEYIRSHLFSRTGWNIFGGTMSYSGTATLFDKKAVVTVGGFDTHNFAQDAEIIMKLHAYMRKNKIQYQIIFNPAATVWTDVPDSFSSFARQRDHWRRSLLRSVLRYWYMFINLVTFNRYKRISDIFRIFILAVIETFGFRQYTVLISLFGTFHYFFNRLRGKPI
ncbi:MAG: glycosyltransferase family 2 protein [Gammaproteobacteria bacterium]